MPSVSSFDEVNAVIKRAQNKTCFYMPSVSSFDEVNACIQAGFSE